jgi:hypothetical protein
MRRVLAWAPILLGLLFLLSLAYVGRARALRGQNDFVAFYTASKLVSTPDLYSRPANLALVKETLGFNLETVVYIRPPFYAAILKPLSYLPYLSAYAVFTALTFSSILFFVIRFARDCPPLPVFASLSIPFLSVLLNGQDTPFLLALLGLAILEQRKGRDFSAGLLLSLCSIKFHLFLFLPLLWVLKRRWKNLQGASAGAAGLWAISIAVAGWEALPRYIAVLRDPWINADPGTMPNLHGLAATLGGGLSLEVAFGAIVVAAFLWMTQNSDNYEMLFATCLVCGLLLSFHSGIADCVLLYPVFCLTLQNTQHVPARVASALVLSPVPFALALAGAPYSSALPFSLLCLLGLLCLSQRRSEMQQPQAAQATATLAPHPKAVQTA